MLLTLHAVLTCMASLHAFVFEHSFAKLFSDIQEIVTFIKFF